MRAVSRRRSHRRRHALVGGHKIKSSAACTLNRPDSVDFQFAVDVRATINRHVVMLVGELDVASRDRCIASCVAGDHTEVIVDMAGVTFMDCSGYSSLMTARRAAEKRGGSLALRWAIGQPRHLLSMFSDLESSHCAS